MYALRTPATFMRNMVLRGLTFEFYRGLSYINLMLAHFSIIIASDAGGGIALESESSPHNTLPWAATADGKKDMAFFRRVTEHSIVIMGRRTFEAIGRPLPTRFNIVITSCTREQMIDRMPKYKTKPELFDITSETAWIVARSLNEALEMAAGINTVHNGIYVIGGAALLATAVADLRLQTIFWSHIPGDYSCNVLLPHTFTRFVKEFTPVKYEHDASYCSADVSVYRLENTGERKYKNALRKLLNAPLVDNRTGIPARNAFNMHFEWPLREAGRATLPLLTLKHTPTKTITEELMWFLSGDQHIGRLIASGVHIWDGNTSVEFLNARGLKYPAGSVGPAYGAQWRGKTRPLPDQKLAVDIITNNVPDQLADVIQAIKTDPFSRRHLVVAWNSTDIALMALPPCHFAMQFHVDPDVDTNGKPDYNRPAWLSCSISMRSCDIALGLPFNAASYGILTHMIAFYCGMRARTLAINATNCHLYETHEAAAREMLVRQSFRPAKFIILPIAESIHKMEPAAALDWLADNLSGCFTIGYIAHPRIQLPMAI